MRCRDAGLRLVLHETHMFPVAGRLPEFRGFGKFVGPWRKQLGSLQRWRQRKLRR
jgi:hypothetical protein